MATSVSALAADNTSFNAEEREREEKMRRVKWLQTYTISHATQRLSKMAQGNLFSSYNTND